MRRDISDRKISIEWLKDKVVSEIKQIEIEEPQLDFAEVLHEQAQYDVQLLQQQNELDSQSAAQKQSQDSGVQEQEFSDRQIIELCRQLSPDFSFSTLYQWQKDLLLTYFRTRTLKRNILITASTASGKTHVISLFILRELLYNKRSVIFVVPYVSLVDELTERFKNLLPGSCCLCALTGLKQIPQFINSKPSLYIVTIEKSISLIKYMESQENCIDQLGLVVVDELHVCCDKNSERSAKLELLMTQLLLYQ